MKNINQISQLQGNFHSAYRTYNTNYCDHSYEPSSYLQNHPPFTKYTHDFKGNVDYIYHSYKNTTVPEVLMIPDVQKVQKHLLENEPDDLPSAVFPSDHLPILASFNVHYQK